MAGTAFDLAERLQTLIFVLSDLILGMNLWISDEFDYPETPLDRGKVLSAEDIRQHNGKWGRYLDEDGDGIPYRTLPGTKHPLAAYFTRAPAIMNMRPTVNARKIGRKISIDWPANLIRRVPWCPNR